MQDHTPIPTHLQSPKLCVCGCNQPVDNPRNRYLPGHTSRNTNSDDEGRFWKHVDKRGPDDCWEWQATKTKTGYGNLSIGLQKGDYFRQVRAHRFSYELHYGQIPDGMEVCHKCDNPGCVNPAHLFLGTHQQNIADKIAKGRQPNGEKLRQSKLTEDSVRLIREMRAEGMPYQEIAMQFGVHNVTILDVVRGKTWRHVK